MNLIDLLKITLTLAVFAFGAWSDIKKREITDYLWIFYFPLGVVLGLLSIYAAEMTWQNYLLSAGITTLFAILLFYVGFYGGADAKALIGLSLTIPHFPSTGLGYIMALYPFPISVLLNSALLSAVIAVPYMLLRNLRWKVRKGPLFEGLEHESVWKKALAMMTGYKISAKEIDKVFALPIEETETKGDKVRKRLKFYVRVAPEEEEEERKKLVKKVGHIWVSPELPLMLSILMGFLVALLYGDLIYALSSGVASLLL